MKCRSLVLWIPALIAVTVLTVSCASAPPRPPSATESLRREYGVTDELLTSTIYSDLNADPIYYFRHVDVRVDNGIAHLSGYVWSTDAIYQARKIVMKVPGVTAVRTTQLQLERNGQNTGPAR